jgi:hypothetical protein
MSSLFEKHNTDAFRINMGPGGWFLCIQDVDWMDDLSTKRIKETYPKWPGAPNLLQSVNPSSTMTATFICLPSPVCCLLPIGTVT